MYGSRRKIISGLIIVKLAFRKCQQAVLVIFQQTCYLFMSCFRFISGLINVGPVNLETFTGDNVWPWGQWLDANCRGRLQAGTNSIMWCRNARCKSFFPSFCSSRTQATFLFPVLLEVVSKHMEAMRSTRHQFPIKRATTEIWASPVAYWKSILEHQATGSLQLLQQLLAIDQQHLAQWSISGVYHPSGSQERHFLETVL